MKMKNLLVFAVLFAYVMTQGSVVELLKMTEKVIRKNSWLLYLNYGCYCGWGGKGTPTDDTDKCCYLHDCCYGVLENQGCNAKIEEYTYSYRYGQLYCFESWCQWASCQCDSAFVLCLKKHLSSYDGNYLFYPDKHCENETPRC
uniref:Phospholipase A2 n=1 Tax=Chrysemys picta bellii TaxID=8478 RepID=A0A8C3PD36_CHRPI